MFWFLMFVLKGKKHFFMLDGSFVAAESKKDAEALVEQYTYRSICVGGFTLERYSFEQVKQLIGGLPFHILDVQGVGLPMEAVEVIGKLDDAV